MQMNRGARPPRALWLAPRQPLSTSTIAHDSVTAQSPGQPARVSVGSARGGRAPDTQLYNYGFFAWERNMPTTTFKRSLVLLALLLAACCTQASQPVVPQWVVVTAPAYRTSLEPLIEHRQAEGFKVVVVEITNVLSREQIAQADATPLQERLQQLCRQHSGPSYILLAGAMVAKDAARAVATMVPPRKGVVGRMKGRPTDHGFGCPDSNSAPTVAVGRFPARNPEELRLMVTKTLKLEQEPAAASWRNHLLVLIGNPGGGTLPEMLAEQAVAPRLRQLHPSWNLRALVHNPLSPFYLPSTQLTSTALRYLQEGELFVAYLGHSGPTGLWSKHTWVSRNDWARLNIPQGAGVFFTCGCFACQLGGFEGEGYGLAALRNPNGPVAVMGATGETYGAPGQLAIDGLIRCLSTPPFPERLGDYWLAVKAGLARGHIDESLFKLYDMFDGSGGKVPLDVQRLEHLEMWLLLGDPALRLRTTPLDVRLEPMEPVHAGQNLTVRGALPDRLRGADVEISLERPIGSKPAGLEKLPASTPENREARERAALANHQRANTLALVSAAANVKENHFECTVKVPLELNWTTLVLRAYATNETKAGLGLLTLPVTP